MPYFNRRFQQRFLSELSTVLYADFRGLRVHPLSFGLYNLYQPFISGGLKNACSRCL